MPKVSEAHLEQRREQILDAAIACFAQRGIHQTTMADIAARAGVSDTLAYRYFSGKDEVIEAAVRRHGDATADDLVGPRGVEDFRALVDMLLETNIRRFGRPEDMKATMGMHFQSWAEALHDDGVRQEVLQRWHRGFDVAEGVIVRAQEQGQLRPDLDSRAMAWIMLATHYGTNVLAALDPAVDLERCKAMMLAMVFGGRAQATAVSPAGGDGSGEKGG